MNNNKKNRKHWLTIRLNDDELNTLTKYFSSTTSKKVSTYARNVLLKKPVAIKYRNQTADEVLAELVLLKKELNAIGNNFNQAVKKLHTTDDHATMKSIIASQETVQQKMLAMTEDIFQVITQLSRKW